MQYTFNINQSRFHMTEPDTYILGGWFKYNNPENNTLKVYLDKIPVSSRVEVYETPDIRARYIAYNAGVTKEYYIYVSLPRNYSDYKKLRIYTVDEAGNEKFSADIPVKTMLMQAKTPDYCVDSVQFRGGLCYISGWCASTEPIQFKVVKTDHSKVAFNLISSKRADVRFLYRECEDMENAGFSVNFKDEGLDEVYLLIKTGELKLVKKMDLAALRKQWEASQAGTKYMPVGQLTLKLKDYAARGVQYIQRNGVRRFATKAWEKVTRKQDQGVVYEAWMAQNMPTEEELALQRETVLDYQPLFSIVIPLYKTPEKYLLELVDSIKAQTYSHWNLYLSDGSGENSPIDRCLSQLEAEDERIHVIRNNKQLRISENTNAGIEAADGEFIVFADHDDLLTANALFECAKALNANPEIDFIYSDEDKISMDGKRYFTPHFKSDFNPDLLNSMNYFCHICVVRRALIDQVGMLDPAYDGAQDYDFVLRCSEATTQIHHIPKVLYHWRADANSTSENPESKMYAFEAGKRAIEDHLARLGYQVSVSHGRYWGLYNVKYLWDELDKVSIIIPNKDHIDDLDKCIRSIEERSSFKNYEYIIVENNSTEEATFEYYKELEARLPHAKVVYYKGDFNFSAINNFGVQYATGNYYLLLNNDTEIINPDCIEEMLSYCMRPDVGIVGARLYYPDDTLQHAGVIIGFGGVAGHAFTGFPKDHNGYANRIICVHDLSAVTAACLMVKKSVYEAVGGLTEDFKVAFNDIDFCLKVREAGYLIVYDPNAELYHYESKSRGYEDTPEKIQRFQNEISRFIEKWPEILTNGDPYYNPNLTLDRQDFSLR